MIDVDEGCYTLSAKSLLKQNIAPQEQEAVRVVVIDIWNPFIPAVYRVLPELDIVHDRFHIIKRLILYLSAFSILFAVSTYA
jgi:transposase